MNVFIVNQNPNSIYDDLEGKRYQYPKRIPCGRQISIGDFLVFNLSKKVALKSKFIDGRITDIAKISDITSYNEQGKEMGIATYDWYKKFDPH
jgi:hypothetical protein